MIQGTTILSGPTSLKICDPMCTKLTVSTAFSRNIHLQRFKKDKVRRIKTQFIMTEDDVEKDDEESRNKSAEEIV